MRGLVERCGCDLSAPVYPGKERRADDPQMELGWYTLGDWMRETSLRRDPSLEAAVAPHLGLLALPACSTTPSAQSDDAEWRAWAERAAADRTRK